MKSLRPAAARGHRSSGPTRLLGSFLLLALATETGCKSNTINAGPSGNDSTTTDGSISSAGGEVVNAALGAKLSIDAGTLAAGEKVRFAISEARPPLTPMLPPTLEAVTRYVSFEPSDRTFARELRLTIDVPGGDHRLYRFVANEWKVEASATFTGGQAKLSTTRLGAFVVAKTLGPVSGDGGKGGAAGQAAGGSAGGGGAPEPPCGEGEIGCRDGLPWTCSASGQRVPGKACDGGEHCAEGSCVASTVKGGAGGELSGGSAGSGGTDAAGSGGAAGSSDIGGSAGSEASGGIGGAGAAASGGSGGSGEGGSDSGGSAGSGGAPACELPDLICGGACVPVKTSQTHCGKCDNACGADQTCADGVCTCNGTATLCGSICVDTLVNASHCGGCGKPCGADQLCTGGACACTGGKTLCGAACVDTLVSAAHCGACGNVCDPGVACQAGHCVSEWAQWRLPGEIGAPFSYQGDTKTVTDTVTTLQWEKYPSTTLRGWDAALSYCNDLVFAGFSDWRVPTTIELISLVKFTTSKPAIDTSVFPTTPSARFWTQSPAIGVGGMAWFVDFDDGTSDKANVGDGNYVRCVR